MPQTTPTSADAIVLDASRITVKGQITLPKTVRKTLSVREGDSVRFIADGGRVYVERWQADADQDDPVIARALSLLEADMGARPGAVIDVPQAIMRAMQNLSDGVAVDPDAPIEGDVAL